MNTIDNEMDNNDMQQVYQMICRMTGPQLRVTRDWLDHEIKLDIARFEKQVMLEANMETYDKMHEGDQHEQLRCDERNDG